MNESKLVNIANLMKINNFEIEELPDHLKCGQCKLVLKDAYQVLCGCRFCRACIDDLMSKGGEFCPGESEECGTSHLSLSLSHVEVNKKISRLVVKCPNNRCVHKCQLTNMEEHLRECRRKKDECPFCELGCTQDKLGADEMGEHLQQDNRRHSEILIGIIANISRDIKVLRQRDEARGIEIENLKQRDKAREREIAVLKHNLVLKDEQIKSIIDQEVLVQIKSIKEDKENLAGRVRLLSEEMEQKIAESRENEELYMARVIDHVDKEIAEVKQLIRSHENDLATEMQLLRGDIGSITQDALLIKDHICFVKSQMESKQAVVGQVDARFQWLIDDDIAKRYWIITEENGEKYSEYFSGLVHPYKYRLDSWNCDTNEGPTLCIELLIHAGPDDEQVAWPFKARVVISVTDRNIQEACRSISRQCLIERPPDNGSRRSGEFYFLHSKLITAGLNLNRGVRVSCVIILDAGQ